MSQPSLIKFFQNVATKEAELLNKLKQDFTFNDTSWEFTIPSLHSFLQSYDDSYTHIDYKQFRKLLFSSSINLEIKSLGAEIKISDNQNNVDQSRYVLIWND